VPAVQDISYSVRLSGLERERCHNSVSGSACLITSEQLATEHITKTKRKCESQRSKDESLTLKLPHTIDSSMAKNALIRQ
jgi:hypothetical protein